MSRRARERAAVAEEARVDNDGRYPDFHVPPEVEEERVEAIRREYYGTLSDEQLRGARNGYGMIACACVGAPQIDGRYTLRCHCALNVEAITRELSARGIQ